MQSNRSLDAEPRSLPDGKPDALRMTDSKSERYVTEYVRVLPMMGQQKEGQRSRLLAAPVEPLTEGGLGHSYGLKNSPAPPLVTEVAKNLGHRDTAARSAASRTSGGKVAVTRPVISVTPLRTPGEGTAPLDHSQMAEPFWPGDSRRSRGQAVNKQAFSGSSLVEFLNPYYESGEAGIRTLGRREPTPVFKTGAIDRSATSPGWVLVA